MGPPYPGGSPPEAHDSYFTDPQSTSAQHYVQSPNRDPLTPMNLPGAFPMATPDTRPFQNTTPRGSSDREPQQRQANNQSMDRYNQENGALPNVRPSTDANNQGRRPSGPRICAKCSLPLSGQFVRALDNTYHLECFTCQVSEYTDTDYAEFMLTHSSRSAVRLSHPSSFRFPTKVRTSIPSARPTTFDVSILSVTLAVVPYEDRTSQRWIENTTLSTSHAPFARPSSALKTATTSTKETSTATTTTRQNLLSAVKAARMPSSNSL
jgi:hypothetical protein